MGTRRAGAREEADTPTSSTEAEGNGGSESGESPERGKLEECWDRAGAFARKRGIQPTVAVLSPDGLTELRQRFGRSHGNRVLDDLRSLLEERLAHPHCGGTWTGSRFAAILVGIEHSDALDLLDEVLSSVRTTRFPKPDGDHFRLTLSAGAVEAPDGESLEEAVARARKELNAARREGGNLVVSPARPPEDRSNVVLVAEDDEVAAAILRHRLTREGYRVVHFADGIDAFEGVLRERPAVAVLDVMLPGMDGLEILSRLREVPACGDLPVLMLTALSRDADVVRAFEAGVSDYMRKPFSPAELVARIRTLLGQR
jgi:diguanylate cyclase (GGDEF)-like protein